VRARRRAAAWPCPRARRARAPSRASCASASRRAFGKRGSGTRCAVDSTTAALSGRALFAERGAEAASTRIFLWDGGHRTLGFQSHARSRPSSTAANGVAQDHVAALDLLASLAHGFAFTFARREDADIVGAVLAGLSTAGRAALRRRRVPTVDLVVVLNGAGSAPQLVQTLSEFKSISHFFTRYGQLDTCRCQAAERRTAANCGERRRICAQLDEKLFVLQPGLVGPMQACPIFWAGLREGYWLLWRVVGRPRRPARELLAHGRARVDGAHCRAPRATSPRRRSSGKCAFSSPRASSAGTRSSFSRARRGRADRRLRSAGPTIARRLTWTPAAVYTRLAASLPFLPSPLPPCTGSTRCHRTYDAHRMRRS